MDITNIDNISVKIGDEFIPLNSIKNISFDKVQNVFSTINEIILDLNNYKISDKLKIDNKIEIAKYICKPFTNERWLLLYIIYNFLSSATTPIKLEEMDKVELYNEDLVSKIFNNWNLKNI